MLSWSRWGLVGGRGPNAAWQVIGGVRVSPVLAGIPAVGAGGQARSSPELRTLSILLPLPGPCRDVGRPARPAATCSAQWHRHPRMWPCLLADAISETQPLLSTFFFCLHLHPYLLSVTFAFISLPPPPSESCTCVEWSLALAHWRPSLTRWLCTWLWGCPGLTSPRWARDLNFCNSSLLRGSGATAWQAWAERAKSPPWACHAGRTLNTFI